MAETVFDTPPDPGRRVRIYIGESDHKGPQPLFAAIVESARRAGLGGATVFKAIEGYGAHSVVHAAHIVDLSADLPIVIEIIDSAVAIDAFLPKLRDLVHDGLITIEDVTVIHRSSKKPAR